MSSLQDKKAAVAEQARAVETEAHLARIALKERYRSGQGEFVGDMAGAFGAVVGGRWGRALVVGAQLTIMLVIGLAAAAGLIGASG